MGTRQGTSKTHGKGLKRTALMTTFVCYGRSFQRMETWEVVLRKGSDKRTREQKQELLIVKTESIKRSPSVENEYHSSMTGSLINLYPILSGSRISQIRLELHALPCISCLSIRYMYSTAFIKSLTYLKMIAENQTNNCSAA
jgi:hypothetical protein